MLVRLLDDSLSHVMIKLRVVGYRTGAASLGLNHLLYSIFVREQVRAMHRRRLFHDFRVILLMRFLDWNWAGLMLTLYNNHVPFLICHVDLLVEFGVVRVHLTTLLGIDYRLLLLS